jgi:hypothetical protein
MTFQDQGSIIVTATERPDVIAAIVMFDPNGHGVGNFTNEQKAGS